MAFHYLGLAKRSLQKGLVGGEMDIKKYFYVLRPLLAARWILELQTAPPMEFEPLLDRLQADKELYATILALTKAKIAAQEGDKIAPVPLVQDFIQQALQDYPERAREFPVTNGDYSLLDRFFRDTLNKAHNVDD